MTTFPHVVGPIARIAARARWREKVWWIDWALAVSGGSLCVCAVSAIYLCFALGGADFAAYRFKVIVAGIVGPLAGATAYAISGGLIARARERPRPIVGSVVAMLGAVGGLPPAVALLRLTWASATEVLMSPGAFGGSMSWIVFWSITGILALWTAALVTAWIVTLARAWAWMRADWSFARSTFAVVAAVAAAIAWIGFDPFDAF
jgi:hypothetical protein